MSHSPWRTTFLLAIPLMMAAALPLVSLPKVNRTTHSLRLTSEGPETGIERPPDDWFIAQRMTHGGIPRGAPGKARAQAAALAATAAQNDPQHLATAWDFVGPTSIAGRVVDIAVDPVLADTLYVAAATGGVWKSSDRGETFTSIWPDENPNSMGAIAMGSDGTLFAGTGEANPGGGSITYGGEGIYRSRDRGVTWEHVGLTNSGTIGRIVVDPTNPLRVLVAAAGSLYNPGGERGVYESTDGGSAFTLLLAGGSETTGAVDLAIDPSNPSRIYAAMWDRYREPDLEVYGGPGSGVYRSIDSGTTWQRLTRGLPSPSGRIGRIGIAVAPNNPERVYAIVSRTNGALKGFYRSDDGGDSWSRLVDADDYLGQVFIGAWCGRVWVDPLDQDHVFVAATVLSESKNGGSHFNHTNLSPHVDDHAMAWDLKVPNRVYLGTDGGVYRSDINGSDNQWSRALSQPFTQFYSVDVSEQDSSRLVGGTQDNSAVRSYGGRTGWSAYVIGDGEETLIDPLQQNLVYGCIQFGVCNRSNNGGDSISDFTSETVSSRRNWFTPLQFDPANPAILYYAGDQVNRSTDHGATWSVISPDLTGGPGRGFLPFGTITTVAGAKTDPNRVLAGTDDGRLWFTTDLGGNWIRVTDSDVPGTWVTRVTVDPANSLVAYATFSGFRSGDSLPYVLKTTDGGTNWTDIASNLPQAPVNDIVVVGPTLYVGTDVGVYSSSDGAWNGERPGRACRTCQ